MSEESKITQVDLDKLIVEPVTDVTDIWDVESVLSRLHPLGNNKPIGHRMYFVARLRHEWVAVLVFNGAVKQNNLREHEIGWSKEQRDERLKHVANNSRFLVAPKYEGVPNLASKVLALTTERISDDWFRRYGIPLLAVETYVDPQHNNNQGTCYTAAGWKNLGYSTGYQAYQQERTHGKLYFLKHLHPQSYAALSAEIPHALLTGVKDVSGKSNNNYVLDASRFSIKDLQKDLQKVTDPRKQHGCRYQFVPLLSLCIAAAISGYTQYRQMADWISKLPAADRAKFGLRGDMCPQETTIGNLLRAINPSELQEVLSTWLRKTYPQKKQPETIILDGKALCATSSETHSQVGFLNVFAAQLGIVIEQLPTQKGGGEKKSAREFVDKSTDLEGKIVLADAIHTDRLFIAALQKKTLSTSSLLKKTTPR